MTKSAILFVTLLGLTISSSAAEPMLKPAAKVSKISFLLKHRAPEQHKDRLAHGRK
ncbi:MAG TPA: hypothetical protein VGJ06_13740 [Candidatus Acidoferrum sp.]|jgi:hypothetical protein